MQSKRERKKGEDGEDTLFFNTLEETGVAKLSCSGPTVFERVCVGGARLISVGVIDRVVERAEQ